MEFSPRKRIKLDPAATNAPYSILSDTFVTLSATRSRLLIIDALTNCLYNVITTDPKSLAPALYLLSNSLSPPYSTVELGLGPSIISKAIQTVSGLTPAAMKRLYTRTGDPGDVAFEAKSNVRTLVPHPPLTIQMVYKSLLAIANSKGNGAGKQKQSLVEKLLLSSKGEETRFLVRTLCMNLRVGAVRTSILTALGRAMIKKEVADPTKEDYERGVKTIKSVHVQHPNYDHIATALMEHNLSTLAEHVPLQVGIPLLPTLGSPSRSLDEVYERLNNAPFAAEYKYDGQRAQIHCQRNGKTAIFSRHLEDMTTKYPDVVECMDRIFETSPTLESFIIDSEVVAIDPVDGSLKTFQELSNRARKDVSIHNVKINVAVYAFDLMYLNGEILLGKTFRERRQMMQDHLPPILKHGLARFGHVESCESSRGREAIEEFWQSAVDSKCEGLMIKMLDNGVEGTTRKKPLPATYEPDKRTLAWLKLKKDYIDGIGDSIDMVPIAAYHGQGRKCNWWSPILLGIRDPRSGKFVAVCKCMSGFSDVFYKATREKYTVGNELCSDQPLWSDEVDTGGYHPDVYFKPSEVWEIRGADITLSPVSRAAIGLVSDSRGLSLRFPRFTGIVRQDKSIDQASDVKFLADLWSKQTHGPNATADGGDDLVDVFDDEDEYGEEEELEL